MEGGLLKAHMVRIQNVVDYFYAASGKEFWDRRIDYPFVSNP